MSAQEILSDEIDRLNVSLPKDDALTTDEPSPLVDDDDVDVETEQAYPETPRCPVIAMSHVDPSLLDSDLPTRIQFIKGFMNWSSSDADALKKIAPHVAPTIPDMVDSMYEKLFEFDITKVCRLIWSFVLGREG